MRKIIFKTQDFLAKRRESNFVSSRRSLTKQLTCETGEKQSAAIFCGFWHTAHVVTILCTSI